MTKTEVTVLNPTGLHARPAAEFVRAAKGFESGVCIRNTAGGEAVSAKSIVKLLALGLNQGCRAEISAEGPDEAAAVAALAALVEGGFGEL